MPKNYEYPCPEGGFNRTEQPYHFTADAFSAYTKRKPQKLAPALEHAEKMERVSGLINSVRNALDKAEKLLATEERARLKNLAFDPHAADGSFRRASDAMSDLRMILGL
ncbi:hypothetical protein [uncultured Sutterella sp.]|uniref:hypothetical protein n=1 Tax=uncultured Sutterella sp. TaxID=286133 RepID=UPI0020660A3D|nr:hypothetical protein [uncultured Sutterella sp.]DAL55858.1 MAG TPA_asm: hypothetical protein [Caudoviricetes sp.]